MPFFESFVTTFNYTHNSIGFGLSINAPIGVGIKDLNPVKPPSPGPTPIPDDPTKRLTPPLWMTITLVITAIVVVLILILLVIHCLLRIKKDRQAREIAYA